MSQDFLNGIVKNGNRDMPQSVQANERQVLNNAGGYTFTVTPEARLNRFLTLGVDANFYSSGNEVATDNSSYLIEHIRQGGGADVVKAAVDVSTEGRAPKNDAALFALAAVLQFGDDKGKRAAKSAVVDVARTGTHLFTLLGYIQNLGGMGRAKKRAVASWYESKTDEQLAFQAVKYRNRKGYTHRDAMRISHPKGIDPNIGNFILDKDYGDVPSVIVDYVRVQDASEEEAVDIIRNSSVFFWEMLPTRLHKSPLIWRALIIKGMGQMALIRNLRRFSALGLFDDAEVSSKVTQQLSNKDAIKRSRIHPIHYLKAIVTLEDEDMHPVPGNVIRALNDGLEASYGNVKSSGKKITVALDVSGSMYCGASDSGLSPMVTGSMLAYIFLKTEPHVEITRFSSDYEKVSCDSSMDYRSFYHKVKRGAYFGVTDCALPMVHARKNGESRDAFVVITDNETWYGSVHPHQALRKYNSDGHKAKLVVAAMTPTNFSIADPDAANMLDVSGFDTNVPSLVADFIAREL